MFDHSTFDRMLLHRFVHSQVGLGLEQAMVVSALALGVAWLGHLRKLELGRETAAALVRGLLQMLAIGLVLVWLLKGAAWWSFPALAAMCAMAARMAQKRAKSAPHSYWLCLRAIGTGSAVVIATMALTRVIAFKATAAGAAGLDDYCKFDEHLLAGSGALRKRSEAERGKSGGGAGIGRKLDGGSVALREERNQRSTDPEFELAALAGDCVDSGLCRRNAADRERSGVHGDLSVHGDCNDLCGERSDGPGGRRRI